MLVDRMSKETTDQSRFVLDFNQLNLLDVGEKLSLVSSKIIAGTTGWSTAPFPQPGVDPPYDPTPLLFESVTLDATRTVLVVFVQYGTPGATYTCQFILSGTSARRITVELGVQIEGDPPAQPSLVPMPVRGAMALPIEGGVLTGPLYLFADPTYPTEAATKSYVDTVITDPAGLSAEAAARTAADHDEAVLRFSGDDLLARQNLVFQFPPGHLAPNATRSIPTAVSLTLLNLLTGCVVYAGTPPTANFRFTVNKVSGSITSAIGGITLAMGSNTVVATDGTGADFVSGDVLQVVGQTTPDATIADVTVTLYLMRQ